MVTNSDLQTALAFLQKGELDDAEQEALRILKLAPRNTDAMQVLGLVYTSRGNFAEAIRLLKQAATLAPGIAGYRNNLGNAYLAARELGEAVKEFKYAINLNSGYSKAYLGLSIALLKQHRGEEAEKTALKGLAIQPGWTHLEAQLAEIYLHTLQTARAIEKYQEIIGRQDLKPEQYSNYLLALQYSLLPAETIMQEHKKYGALIESKAQTPSSHILATNGKDRLYRIGILSNDLRTHSVAYFVQGLFRYKPEHVQLTVFYGGSDSGQDELTQFFQNTSDEWISIQALTPEKINKTIALQNIDILLELGGHTAGNHLAALDPKPAPLIVHGIGYPHSTGHPSINLRLTDKTAEPEEDPFSSEEKIYIEDCFLHYTPPSDSPLPSFPDAQDHFFIGCYNLGHKISEKCIAVYSEILLQLPHAKLLLKSVNSSDPLYRKNLLTGFENHGVDAKNLKFLPYSKTTREHLEQYQKIHIALDTFPYNGTTTTCEALWMGVPVITMKGDRHAARVGCSILNAAGLPDFIADNEEQFIEKVVGMAGEPDILKKWRNDLRPWLQTSWLFDGAGYAQKFYQAVLQKTEAAPVMPRTAKDRDDGFKE